MGSARRSSNLLGVVFDPKPKNQNNTQNKQCPHFREEYKAVLRLAQRKPTNFRKHPTTIAQLHHKLL